MGIGVKAIVADHDLTLVRNIKFDYSLINIYPILGKVRGIMTAKCPNANQILESWAEEEWEECTKGGCYD
jgi:hypothetical protein